MESLECGGGSALVWALSGVRVFGTAVAGSAGHPMAAAARQLLALTLGLQPEGQAALSPSIGPSVAILCRTRRVVISLTEKPYSESDNSQNDDNSSSELERNLAV